MKITADNVDSFLNKLVAQPKTHKVVSTYADGATYVFEAPSKRSAENYANTVARPKLNKNLISRKTGKTVCVVKVDVEAI
jgi:hypothetical protein